MEPNDQYLCIVPDRSQPAPAEKRFIPFEGDNGLSVILSKAFLLAADDTITDSTITLQINRRQDYKNLSRRIVPELISQVTGGGPDNNGVGYDQPNNPLRAIQGIYGNRSPFFYGIGHGIILR